MKRSDTIAPVYIGQGDTILASSWVGLTIPRVCLAVTDGSVLGCTYFWLVDSQVKYFKALTALIGGCSVSIVSTLGVCLTIPRVRVAWCNCLLDVLWLVDSQVQGYDTIAAVGSRGGVHIIATLGIGGIVPNVGVACDDGFLNGRNRIDCQMQNNHTIATLDILQSHIIIAFSWVCLTIPRVGLAVADSGGIVGDRDFGEDSEV